MGDREAHDRGWDVLLDCAAFAPTNRLDLSAVKPDFVPLSFYKMFGYPTGIGALAARHEALAQASGVPGSPVGPSPWPPLQGEGWYHLAPGHTGFEDGTVDYLGLPAVSSVWHTWRLWGSRRFTSGSLPSPAGCWSR